VLAFEPVTHNFEILRAVIRLARLNNVSPYRRQFQTRRARREWRFRSRAFTAGTTWPLSTRPGRSMWRPLETFEDAMLDRMESLGYATYVHAEDGRVASLTV
jgi:hypothetical protein